MRKNYFYLLFLLISFLVTEKYAHACSPYGVPTLLSQTIVGTNLQLQWRSNTGWACTYWVTVEIVCAGQPFTGNNTYTSPAINKSSSASQNYPSLQIIDISSLCPGATYNFRARECANGSFFACGGYTGTFSFTVPGTSTLTVTASANPKNICLPATSSVSATSSGGCGSVSYSWNQGLPPTAGPHTVSPAVPTTYIVTVTDGCGGATAIDSVRVIPTTNPTPGTASISPPSVCIGDSTILNLTGYTGQIQWQYGPSGGTGPWTNIPAANTPTYIYSNVTSNMCFRAELSGCSSFVYSNVVCVTLNPSITASFTKTDVCDGFPASFTDNSNGSTTWLWNFGDGIGTSTLQNPTYTYSTIGVYNVTLSVTNATGCKDDTIIPVNVFPNPVTSFTSTNRCLDTALTFTNTSTIAGGGTIVGYLWDFGDGIGSSTQPNPSYLYTNCGSFPVKLTAVSNNGCVDSITNIVQVYCLPTANFSYSTVCVGSQTCFYDSSNVVGSNISQWQWNFGDGSPINTLGNPCYTYAAANQTPGYSVSLTVNSAQGCVDSVRKNVPVQIVPTASFSVNNECVNTPVSVIDNSLNSVNYNWDFGDGTNSTTAGNQTHPYALPGTYTIQLIVNSTICADTFSSPVVLHPIPTADYNFTNVCDGLPLSFNDLSTVQTGAITQWNWSYGDATANGNTQNTNHLYSSCGKYNVNLSIVSDSGCTDTITKQVEVYPNPVAGFTPTEVCLGTASQFTDLTTISCGGNQGTIVSWNWNFGNGSTSTVQNPSNTYAVAGVYSAQLAVSSSYGCVDTIINQVTVQKNPDVNFTSDVNSGCTPLCVNFINNSVNTVGVTTYNWSYGDGSGATTVSPSYCYTNDSYSTKTYDVSVLGITDYGTIRCSTSVTQTSMITVYPLPQANFTWEPTTLNIFYSPEAAFTDLSKIPNNWYWNFGDGDSSLVQHPKHTYKDSGNYIVWLYISTQYGCKDSIWKQLRVEPDYAIYIPNTFTPDGDATNNSFFAKGYGIKEISLMIFDRWGELIYEGINEKAAWNGRVKGGDIGKTDTYVYRIEVQDVKGDKHTYTGKVTLLK